MGKKIPIYLTKIETSIKGRRQFKKGNKPYMKIRDKIYVSKLMFKFRKAYIDKPNCDFNCPPGRAFFCCKEFNCVAHCGFFIWEELSIFSEDEKEEILSLWNNGTGFYRKNGCVLPRELRSIVCLSWACPYSKNNPPTKV